MILYFNGYKLSYTDIIQVDSAIYGAHLNYSKSPIFDKVARKDLESQLKEHEKISGRSVTDIVSYQYSIEPTYKNPNPKDRIILWENYWQEYIKIFVLLINLSSRSIATTYIGRHAIELGFKYLLLKKTDKIYKTHDLAELSHILFQKYNITEEYMQYIDLFCNKYCRHIEGGNSEYFKYPEYRYDTYFAGDFLDADWICYNFTLIILKLIKFSDLEIEILN